MHSKQLHNKTSKHFNDVNIGTDKGSLRLQFSTRISEKFYSKRQAYKGLGRSDTSDNRIWAEGVARRIQEDIDYQNGANFDPTLTKYLDVKPMLATITQLPTAKPLPALGELWSEFVEWKWKTKQIEETTYLTVYKQYTNKLSEFLLLSLDAKLADQIILYLSSMKKNHAHIKALFHLLSRMCQRAISKKLLAEDYFAEIKTTYTIPKKSKQLAEEEDYKAYTIKERDLIINAFHNHENTSIRHSADLIEFLFLTGCRHGEAFALRWKHIKFDTGWIIFSESFDSVTRITKGTKTDVDRLFKMQNMDKLINLLKKMYEDNKNPEELVFKTIKGKQYITHFIFDVWKERTTMVKGKKYSYDGVVKKLADEGRVRYLKPYSTRHTFINIQANNGADLKLLADSCGNSVDTIIEHYLDTNRNATLKNL